MGMISGVQQDPYAQCDVDDLWECLFGHLVQRYLYPIQLQLYSCSREKPILREDV